MTRDSAVDSNSNCEDALAAHDLEDGGYRVGSTRDSAVDSDSNRSVAPAADNWQQVEEGFDSDDQDVDGQAFQDVTEQELVSRVGRPIKRPAYLGDYAS